MLKRKETFHFSVEGKTEKWYLEWLQYAIKNEPAEECILKINIYEQNPFSIVKNMQTE